jgi:excisionase family DNA binding protein
MSDLPAFLSARAAAELAGVDERTVRRWVQSGQLAADKRGGRFRIPRSALGPFIQQSDRHLDGHERAAAAEADVSAAPDNSVVSLELVRLVAKLQEENRVMAGRIGWLEAQIEHLKALPAAPPDTLPEALRGDSGGVPVETAQEPSAAKRPWWRFW